jgi:hypothetical protein
MRKFNVYYFLFGVKSANVRTISVDAEDFESAVYAAHKALGDRINVISVFKAQ